MGRPKVDPALRAARGAFRKNPQRAPEEHKPARKSGRRRDYAGLISGYTRDVLEGRILVCKWTRLAVQRHVSEIATEKDRAFPYRFDEKAVAAVLARMERLPHVKGKWARRAERISLQPWQCFIVACIFGWKRKRDGLRRFREAYIECPRKNGKSVLGAIFGIEFFAYDGEHGAEVYSGAGTERQAHEVFTPAKLMLQHGADVREEAGIEIWSKALVRPEDNSKFWPVVGKPGDGASPSCAIIDEYHEHLTSELYDTMVSGMGAREQPLTLIITTAGTDLASPCRDKHLEAEKVLQGTIENDEMFSIIYTIDDEDDWTSPAAIRKANPNFDISVDQDFLLAQQRQAITNPAHQNRFRTKHLCQWCAASVAGINAADWNRAADPSLSIDQFNGAPAIFSLDLASKLDICDFVQLFARQIDGQTHYFAFARHYIPEETVEEVRVNQLAYRKWIAEGRLTATEGAEIDFDEIRADVSDYRSRFQATEVVYDPWRATQLAHQLAKDGATVVEMAQSAKNMAAAFDELLSALKAGRFHHDGDPVLAWMGGNVVAKSVAKGLTVPSKEKPDSKIDGIVAICMALARVVTAENVEQPDFQIYVLS
jgi:phage terminase large subunit-like protein